MYKSYFTFVLALFISIVSVSAQDNQGTLQPVVDELLKEMINDYRIERQLGSLIESEVLNKSSEHHSLYMATTRIVSHYQTMNLVSMSSIYSPRKRVDFFSRQNLPDGMNFSEVVVGVKSGKKSPQELATELFESILSSQNRLPLTYIHASYMGLSTVKRKNEVYLTIKFGIDSNHVLTILD